MTKAVPVMDGVETLATEARHSAVIRVDRSARKLGWVRALVALVPPNGALSSLTADLQELCATLGNICHDASGLVTIDSMSCTARGGAMDYQIGVSISDRSPLASGGDPMIDDLPDRRSGGLKPVGAPNKEALSRIQLPGGEAVLALAGGVADQISTMAREIHDRLSAEESASGVDPDEPVPPGRRSFEVDTVTVEFGLSASAKSGVGLAVFADIGGSSSINVTMTVKRVRPTEPVGARAPDSATTP